MTRSLRRMALAAAAAAFAGCTAIVPTPTAPPQLELPAASGAAFGALDRWWTMFNDSTLDRLIDEALGNNLEVKTAIARIDAARAEVKLAQRDLYPSVDATAGAQRTRATQAGAFAQPGIPPVTNDFRLGLQATYEADLWGKFRTATRVAQAELAASQYARETVRTVVAADTARLYFNLLAADAQLALLEDTLKTRVQAVELQTDRRQAGIIGDYELGTAQAERAGIDSDVAASRRAVAGFESALAVLLGRTPRAVFTPQVARNAAMAWGMSMPALPAGMPSDLLARRPDIRQAEAQLAASSLRIDVARADYFPAVALTADLGTEAAALRNLFSGPALVWGIGAALTQPLFGLKAIEANVEAKTAARNELIVTYTRTVQGAFRDAHDALAANESSRTALAAQTERKDRLAKVLELSDLRYRGGYSPYLEVLDAQRQMLQAQTAQIAAARDVRLAVVDVARALGGGWDAIAAPAAIGMAGEGGGGPR